jgi:hypothetical protein
MTRNRFETMVVVLVVLAFYLLLAFKTLGPYCDTDLWWHLAVGKWIVEHREVPHTDPFSRMSQESPPGTPWVAYSWLYEVLIYKVYQTAGLPGVILYRTLMASAIFVSLALLMARYRPHFLIVTQALGLAVLALMPVMTERPWLFTILFSIWTLHAVLRWREQLGGWVVWLLPLVYVVWANVHIQFVYGLFILGLACVAPVLDRLYGEEPTLPYAGRLGTPAWRRLLVLTAACAAATLLNPHGPSLYGVVYEYATQAAPFQTVVDELSAPSFRFIQDWAGLALFGAAAFALGRRRKASAFGVLLLAAAAVLAFRAKRDFWFVAVTALALLARSFPASAPRPRRLPVELVGGLGFAAVAVVLFGWALLAQDYFLQKDLEKTFPVKAVAFVKEKGYRGPLFNHFGWGGYLIWALPELPVSIDGRTNLYGPQRISQVFHTARGLPGWRTDPNLVAAQVVLLDRNLPLAELLRLDSRFEKVYEDDPQDGIAVVFVARR